MPPKPCLGCGTPGPASRCPECRPKRTHRTPQNPIHASYQWKKLSKSVRKYSPQCERCGHTGSDDNPLSAEHIFPVSTHPEYAYERLALACLCRRCNARKLPWPEARRQAVLDAIAARTRRQQRLSSQVTVTSSVHHR